MYAVIMAGGKGARFWPRSREHKPKHLLDITGTRTIIQETVSRISSLIPPDRTLIITGAAHADELRRQLPEIPAENILVEPVGRNTAPCIGLAAIHIRRRAGDAVMAVLPSDHVIADDRVFLDTLAAAAEAAEREDALVTIGIKPTGPETGYGYIERGNPVGQIGGKLIYGVWSIREKPPLEQAMSFVEAGTFYWNSGMFIWKTSTILQAIETHLPDLHAGLLRLEAALGTEQYEVVLRDTYEETRSISIDYGVMEKADKVLVIPGNFAWSDVGSWDALWEFLEKDFAGNACRGEVIAVESADSLVYSPKKLVALVGVRDLIVVETDDALLICRRGDSQKVKSIVDILEEKNLKNYLE
ncbi:mannose-1-phosphate guanylyltransferase [Syntrophus aciditrophicus]|uniref:mannose-1-phosphate guanylyltransferase n=1 Tax=Syntrophus aciditrophicus (strain SB) TaxID=56780 RepID=Q2LSE4_SYNAS|nr:mannose-1-phosphate guanylyltransferase [Syntrophus aciditrophicus]ABC77001.1 mannose-1-phosphate guanylyltransferase [Syntrophus aciditrophicus SB]